jgi:hypothetical protein
VNRPIGDYALLSDCQGAALVSGDGSIDWACMPRFDSPALFARLLDPSAGHWRIAPTEPAQAQRQYLPDTMVLRTEFRTAGGTVALTDALVFGPDELGHRIGRSSPHVIVRRLEGIDGSVEVEVDLAPRAGYGLTAPVLVAEPGGLRSCGGPHAYVVSTDVPLQVRGSDACTNVRVAAGEVLHFALSVTSPWHPPPALYSSTQMAAMLDTTLVGWRGPGPAGRLRGAA